MCSGCERIVNGILWEMSELITQELIAVFKLGGGVNHMTRHTWPLTKVKRSKVKVTKSRNVSAAITLLLGNGGRINIKLDVNFHQEVRIT